MEQTSVHEHAICALLYFTRLSEIQFDSIDITGADLSDCFYLEEPGGKIQTIKITAKFIEKKIASEEPLTAV